MARLFNWHWLAVIVKVALGVTVLLLSGILSYSFFQSIKPAGMDVFPFAALSLTEGGLIAWIVIFSTMKHHVINSLIALLMIGACFITTIVVTFAELIVIFQDHSLVDNATIKNGTLILLEIMLALHVLAAVSDFLIGKIEWLVKTWVPVNHMLTPPERQVMIEENRQSEQMPQHSTHIQEVPQDMQKWLSMYQESGDAGTMSFPDWLKQMHTAISANGSSKK
jgi:hypothetical protein